MNAEQLRSFKHKTPFKAFTIHMSDGTEFLVDDPESLVLPKDWSTDAIVTLPKGRFAFVYLKNVTHVSSETPWPKMKNRRNRGGTDET